MKPLSPEELREELDNVPAIVIKVVNELLIKSGRTNNIKLMRKDVVNALMAAGATEVPVSWLNFEQKFRAAGWEVVYDSPAYWENSDAFWMFERAISPP